MTSSTELPTLAQVCQGPLLWRVQAATRLLNECSAKDFPSVFREVVQSVFGTAGPAEPGMLGWGMQVFTRSQHPSEYQLLIGLLSSQGVIVAAALRHAQDPYMLFDFPVAFLPASAQAGIAEGSGGPLYAGKLHVPGPGKPPHTLMLNSFEFYLFHFCYYLVHLGQLEGGGGSLAFSGVGDAVYPTLLEDYLTAFLPCDGSAPLALGGTGEVPLASRLAASSLQQLSNLMSPISSPHYMGVGSPYVSTPHTSSPLLLRSAGHPSAHQPHRPTAWTSQTVAQVLVEMWVNQCQPATGGGRHSRNLHSPPSSVASRLQLARNISHYPQMGEGAAPVEYRPNWRLQPEPFGIGTSIMSEHVRAVRMIIKHFHYFSNSMKPAQPSPLDSLRRTLWPMCRKSFYQLFMRLLERWPLDSSFRLLLEAWLSYIQPWRYTDINKLNNDAVQPVAWQWQQFVADNLLLYSSILAAVLPRLLRLDLSAPRNSHMLYRISKVLALPNLSALIEATEESLQYSPHSLMSPSSASPESPQHGSGRLSPHAAMMSARAHILEMEGNNFVYTPVFGPYTQGTVREVLVNARSAEMAVQSELDAIDAPRHNSTSGGGVIHALQRGLLWLQSSTGGSTAADNTADEMHRSLQHLQAASEHLHRLFQISELGLSESFSSDYSPSKMKAIVPEQVRTVNGLVLTDAGRRQLLAGLRRKDIKFEGDPDLRPIGLKEFAFLVRWCYALATALNTRYGPELSRGYYSHGLLGVVYRCVLQPPLTVYEYSKPGPTATPHATCNAAYPMKLARHLPPRFSFRRAASRQAVLSVFACCLVLSVVFGLSIPAQLLCVLPAAVLLFFTAQLLLCRNVLRPCQMS